MCMRIERVRIGYIMPSDDDGAAEEDDAQRNDEDLHTTHATRCCRHHIPKLASKRRGYTQARLSVLMAISSLV